MAKDKEPLTVTLVKEESYMAANKHMVKLDTDSAYWVNGSNKIEQAPWHVPIVDKISSKDVRSILYQKKFSFLGVIAGLALLGGSVGTLLTMIVNSVYNLWLLLVSPVGVLIGLVFVFGIKRRQLIFKCKNQNIDWVSGPLEFKDSGYTVLTVKDWANQHHIATEHFPTAMEVLNLKMKS